MSCLSISHVLLKNVPTNFRGHLVTIFYDYAGLTGRRLVMMDGGLILFVGFGVVM